MSGCPRCLVVHRERARTYSFIRLPAIGPLTFLNIGCLFGPRRGLDLSLTTHPTQVMNMNVLRFCAASLVALSLTVSASAFAHGPSEKITILQDQMLKNVPGKKALMIEVDYKPGQSSIAHRHDGTAMAYVLEGEITSQVKGEKEVTYKAGEFWYEAAGSEHLVSKNASKTKPAKLLVFMVLSPDEEVLVPLKN